jgi:Xaa-Pro aminopeptidase
MSHPPYGERRQAFSRRLGDAAALLPTGKPQVRSRTTHFAFRPDSDFYYLTGFSEPDAVLLLLPGSEGPRSVLFLRERDARAEAWDGPRLGVEAAPAALGIEAAYPITELAARLPGLLAGRATLCYPLGCHPDTDALVLGLVGPGGLQRDATLATVTHARALLHPMRVTKDADEVAWMRRAADATAAGHRAALNRIRPGVSERGVRAAFEEAFFAHGAEGPAYEPIVASGPRATVLHAPATDRPLGEGELVLLDVGAEVGFYACDVTRTVPVTGRFTAVQRAVYDVVLGAQEAAIAGMRPGEPIDAYHQRAQAALTEGLVALGVLAGDPEALLAEGAQKPFTLHHTGHFLGLDTHDVGAYSLDGAPRPLEAGMVLTVEPGLYFPPGAPGVDPALWGIGVRIEDDVLITETGHEVLTAAIPKQAADVEAMMARTPSAIAK